jgi:DMSO reductase anchor subunit
MLVLTQVAVGAFVADLVVRWMRDRAGAVPVFDAVVVVAAASLALGASVLHLGRPRYCYRAIIGLRHSWLSREVVAFGAFTGLAVPYAAVLALGPAGVASSAIRWAGVVVAVSGALGVVCSVLIYSRTHRASWSFPSVATKFALTAAIGGMASLLWMSSVSDALGTAASHVERSLFVAVAVLTACKLAGEAAGFRRLWRPEDSDGTRRARLLTGALRTTARRRFSVGVVGGVLLPLLAALVVAQSSSLVGALLATGVLAGVIAGELLERTLFFTAASAP